MLLREIPLVELNIQNKSLLKLFVVVFLLRLEKKIEMDYFLTNFTDFLGTLYIQFIDNLLYKFYNLK